MNSAVLGVLFVHGMGNIDRDYAEPLRRSLVDALGERAGDVAFSAVHYRDPLEASQAELWERWKGFTGGSDHPDTAFVRYGLVVSGFGDVLAYVQKYRGLIQSKVAASLEQLQRQVGPNAPLCIVAHSLGSVVAEDYVRDHAGDSGFTSAQTLTGLYTLGSPLPLFRLNNELPPVAVPGRAGVAEAAEWVNFYSRSDVFGMPLQILGDAYASAVEDIESDNRGLIDGHLGYWRSRDVAKRIAAGLRRILDSATPSA